MGKRGTKPTPTALKILAGAQPCRINRDEPRLAIGAPEKPDYVADSPHASKKWDDLVSQLVGPGVLAEADGSMLALLCMVYGEWRRDPSDANMIAKYHRLLVEFGLSPSSRSTLKVSGEKPKDELAEFLARSKRQA